MHECSSIHWSLRVASTSSSGMPVNSGLKWDQFYYGTGHGCAGGTGSSTGCTGHTTSFCASTNSCWGTTGSTVGNGGLPSGILYHVR